MGWNHDIDAIHIHQANEFSKAPADTPDSGSQLLFEDPDTGEKFYATVGDLPGGGALDDLTDVDTTGVADGDALVYDADTSTWVPGEGGGGNASYSEKVGDNSETTFEIEHSLDSSAVIVEVIEVSSGNGLVAGTDYGWSVVSNDKIEVVFSSAPGADDALVVVVASGGTSGGGGGGGSGLLVEEEASTDVNFLELEIPSGSTDVRLTGLLRVTANAQFGPMYATVGNGTVDTGSNYKWGYRWKSNSSTGSGRNVTDSKIDLGGGVFPGANSPAGVFAVLDMLIPGYDDTTRDKFVSWTVRKWRADSGTIFVFAEGWAMWDSTAALDVIRFTPASDQIAAGSVIRVFAG